MPATISLEKLLWATLPLDFDEQQREMLPKKCARTRRARGPVREEEKIELDETSPVI